MATATRGRTEKKIATEAYIQERIKDYPRVIRNYYFSLNSSEHTTKMRYIGNVLRFVDYKWPDKSFNAKDFAEIDKFDIEEYVNAISFYESKGELRELKASSKACIYSSLSSFFKFLEENGTIEVSPLTHVKRPKIQQGGVTYLEPYEVKEIENRILTEGVGNTRARGKQENWKYRDFLLFHIPVVNGIRIEALREINVNDIHIHEMTITVTEKGNIVKDVYVDEIALRYIRMWLRTRAELIGNEPDCGALFISNRRKRITDRAIENIIMKYADGINGKHITPHKLRSTFGTNAYAQTGDIKRVAQALGHKTTVPTERYVNTVENRNKETVSIVSNLYK